MPSTMLNSAAVVVTALTKAMDAVLQERGKLQLLVAQVMTVLLLMQDAKKKKNAASALLELNNPTSDRNDSLSSSDDLTDKQTENIDPSQGTLTEMNHAQNITAEVNLHSIENNASNNDSDSEPFSSIKED